MPFDWREELAPFLCASAPPRPRPRSRADALTEQQRFWMQELSPFEFERLATTPADVPSRSPCGEPIWDPDEDPETPP